MLSRNRCARSFVRIQTPKTCNEMARIPMQPLVITNMLRGYLYEVNFVYKRLPAALERAGLATTVQRWGSFFKEQVNTVRDHHVALQDVLKEWDQRIRPCACAEVDDLLNELHHALVSRGETHTMERRVHEVTTLLRRLVVARLDEGIQLAKKLGEFELAQRLESLFTEERTQHDLMQDPAHTDGLSLATPVA